MARVVLGMSGGVDSSVAAYLLKEAGHEVIGLFMRNWDATTNQDVLGNPTLNDEVCEQERDYQDAQKVADQLGIPLHKVNFIETYWDKVFQYFISEYEKGRTPNPDVMCNKMIKFAEFFDYGARFEPDYFAMGHFARIDQTGRLRLLRAKDDNKDQTYFLSQLSADQLKNVLFPIGDYTKAEIRAIAEKLNLATAKKKDSTGICFIGERDFNQFLNNYLPAKPGAIETLDGEVIGEHTGLMHYTIGQRKGLGIGGLKAYDTEPWFVVGKDLERNVLLAAQGYHHEKLYGTHAYGSELNWLSDLPVDGLTCTAKFRHRQADHSVTIHEAEKGFKVVFNEPARAVTPGQAVVFYQGEECLGGGFIDAVYEGDKKLPR